MRLILPQLLHLHSPLETLALSSVFLGAAGATGVTGVVGAIGVTGATGVACAGAGSSFLDKTTGLSSSFFGAAALTGSTFGASVLTGSAF